MIPISVTGLVIYCALYLSIVICIFYFFTIAKCEVLMCISLCISLIYLTGAGRMN